MQNRTLFPIIAAAILALVLAWAPHAQACSVSCSDGSECTGTWKCECVDGSASCTDQVQVESTLTTRAGLVEYMSFLSGYGLQDLNPVINSLDTMYEGLDRDDLGLYLQGLTSYKETVNALPDDATRAIADWQALRVREETPKKHVNQ